LKQYEKESIKKSFLLFFTLQFIFISLLLIFHFKNKVHQLDMQITADIVKCSYTLKCDEYNIDFIKNNKELTFNHLYKEEKKDLVVYFPISNVNTNIMKISFDYHKYENKKEKLYKEVLYEFFIIFIIILIISFIFAKYSIKPIKQALHLNDEFVKDILHDFNTPLSSININIDMLKKIHGQSDITKRLDSSITDILSLQDNLNQHLNNSKLQKEDINLNDIIYSRIEHFKAIFTNIKFTVQFDNDNTILFTNKDAFIRIIDNIISNSCKYSSLDNPYVQLIYTTNKLIIQDNGKGIKNTSKIFDRYFKENKRGIGIGLHIVKKLCEKLDIEIELVSQHNKGTKFIFNLGNIQVIL